MPNQRGFSRFDALETESGNARENVLRFIICGDAGDGKSALIRSLVDHLQAEREQGVATDVADRTFSTNTRSFVVADTPGHEQYTRNMVTGAWIADLAIVLIDARMGVMPQTRRHTTILSLLGIRRVILAINKMDLVGWSRTVYDGIAEVYRDYAQRLDVTDVTCIPVSALTGDNVTAPSDAMGWYHGATLLQALESADVATDRESTPFRMPVQEVNRFDSGFRGIAGTIVSGLVCPGDPVLVCPTYKPSTVSRIVTADGDLTRAGPGQTVTLSLAADIDASAGDVIASSSHPPGHSDQFACHLIWMHEKALLPKRSYLFKIGTHVVGAQITALKYKLNVESLEHVAARTLELNDIAYCNISLDRQIAFDPYRELKETGGFILIDRYTHATVGAGMIDFALRRASNLTRHQLTVDKPARSAQKNQKACVLWLTGLSGAGKSTTANAVEQRLHALGRHSYILDGDNLRHGLTRDLGFTPADRVENVRRIAEVAKLFVDAGLIVLVSVISPFRDEREMARRMMEEGEFIEVFVDAPLEVCERRDPKGLYRKARAGEIKNFTGIDSPYEPPESPDIVLKTAERSVDELADQVIAYLQSKVDSPEP
ncbi:MAG: adenylyl-sulfate kinase [Nitrospira sp. SB0666_bin_27]|nr:adenylyl-sulfate kinase [Nitrospira sp. SB0666_bin_27]MYF24038.1 adenylyl-sulfate kinase [Nitrospira sp. SB0678_bin_10]